MVVYDTSQKVVFGFECEQYRLVLQEREIFYRLPFIYPTRSQPCYQHISTVNTRPPPLPLGRSHTTSLNARRTISLPERRMGWIVGNMAVWATTACTAVVETTPQNEE